MFKLNYEVVGMFFKECIWKIEKAETTLQKPNPLELEDWRGKELKVAFL